MHVGARVCLLLCFRRRQAALTCWIVVDWYLHVALQIVCRQTDPSPENEKFLEAVRPHLPCLEDTPLGHAEITTAAEDTAGSSLP